MKHMKTMTMPKLAVLLKEDHNGENGENGDDNDNGKKTPIQDALDK